MTKRCVIIESCGRAVLSEGGQLLYGGEILPRKDHFVEPTLIAVRYDFSLV
ncbi:MAG: hypothetical protein ABI045_04825 [Flavobacteriales bacterium]